MTSLEHPDAGRKRRFAKIEYVQQHAIEHEAQYTSPLVPT